MWFKEYVFNVLIQPFHLLIYTILVGAAIDLAQTSLIYAVVAIYFLIPAEKLLRKFFGFDNAGTLSAAGSFAGGAVFSAMINKLSRPKPPTPKDEPDKAKNVRRNSGNKVNTEDALFGGPAVTSGGVGPGGAGTVGTDSSGVGPGGVGTVGTDPSGVGSVGAGTGGVFGRRLTAREDTDLYERLTAGGPASLFDLAEGGRGIGGRVGDAAGSIFRHTGEALKNKAKTLPKAAGRKLRRTVLGAAGAMPLAMLAAGVGAATGDPSKAATMAIAAGSAGASFTNSYGDKLAKAAGNITDGVPKAFWGENYKTVQQRKFDKEFLQSADFMDSLTTTLGSSKKAREFIDSGAAQAFLNSNITDKTKIARAAKLMKSYTDAGKGQGEALERAIAITQLNRDVNPGVYNSMSREEAAFKNNMRRTFIARGMSEEQAEDEIDDILAGLYKIEGF